MSSDSRRRWIIIYLLIAMPISGASVDIYVPSLPAMTAYFNTTPGMTQLTISVFLLGYSCFCLLFGPLSDAIGRKKPLVFGAVLYVLSALCITLSPTIYVLLFFRFIQGVGVAAIAGVSRAITPDVFEGQEYYRVVNMTTIAWSIGPIVAPFIGGYFQHYLSWKWCFYTLAFYGFIQLSLMVLVLPETLYQKSSFSFSLLVDRSKTLLSSSVFIGAVFISGFVYACIVVFNTMGPFLIQVVLGRTSIFYGYVALGMGVAFFLGNYVNKRMISRDARVRLDMAAVVMIIAVLVEVAILLVAPINIYNIIIPTGMIIFCCGIYFPNTYGAALRLYPEFSGTASAVLSACFIFLASVASAIASLLKDHHQTDFSVLMLLD